jgi:hypothetical protein
MTPAENYLVLDIETKPLPPELARRIYPEPYRSFRRLPGESEDERWRAWHEETAALDPARSRLCAVGLALHRAGEPEPRRQLLLPSDVHSDDLNEALALRLFEGLLSGAHDEPFCDPSATILVGHYLTKFDLPYLGSRAMARGYGGLSQIGFHGIIDTKTWFDERYRTGAGSSSLGHIATLAGVGGKEEGAGARFWTLPGHVQKRYLARDLDLTWRVAVAMGCVREMDPSTIHTHHEEVSKQEGWADEAPVQAEG